MAPQSVLINNLADNNSLIRIFNRQTIIRLQILFIQICVRIQDLPQINRNYTAYNSSIHKGNNRYKKIY
jgi:hypothetical protein